MKPFCKYIHSKIFVHLLFYFLYWYLLWLYVFIVGPCCFFVYYYSSNGNLPIKHRKSDLAKNYDVIDEISDYHKHFLSISAISISVYSVCLCMYNYYVYVHTHKIDSTSNSPVYQKWGPLFVLLFKTFHTCIFVTKNEFFIFFFWRTIFTVTTVFCN